VNSSGVYHGVATVSGVLRGGLGVADLLRATFPPGSVTGAPKIRAMQIIDELEGALRGPYCGAVGYLSDCGRSVWNVAIRTATLSGTDHAGGAIELVYPVGAGIVADSNPAHEWDETMHKAGVLMAALGLNEPRPSGSGPSA
jgi:anthranilate/para-aminobenzoate synthase component I